VPARRAGLAGGVPAVDHDQGAAALASCTRACAGRCPTRSRRCLSQAVVAGPCSSRRGPRSRSRRGRGRCGCWPCEEVGAGTARTFRCAAGDLGLRLGPVVRAPLACGAVLRWYRAQGPSRRARDFGDAGVLSAEVTAKSSTPVDAHQRRSPWTGRAWPGRCRPRPPRRPEGRPGLARYSRPRATGTPTGCYSAEPAAGRDLNLGYRALFARKFANAFCWSAATAARDRRHLTEGEYSGIRFIAVRCAFVSARSWSSPSVWSGRGARRGSRSTPCVRTRTAARFAACSGSG